MDDLNVPDDIEPATLSAQEAATVIKSLPDEPEVAYNEDYYIVKDGTTRVPRDTEKVLVPDEYDEVECTVILMALEEYGLVAEDTHDLWQDVWAVYVRSYGAGD